jgi:C1A family cysteine protease
MENHIDLSILMVYYLAREMMLPKETHWDNGTYISHAFEVLRRFGVCAEILWPFDPKKVTESPSWDAMRSAYSHKIHNYYQITATHKDRIDSVITAIQSGHPVVFGTAIGLNWFGYKKDQVLKPVANADIRGRHATVIVDWDEERELFKGENSWGLHWGDNGFYWMSPSYVAWSQSSDFWVPTMPWED